jgi:hypothetical protein
MSDSSDGLVVRAGSPTLTEHDGNDHRRDHPDR